MCVGLVRLLVVARAAEGPPPVRRRFLLVRVQKLRYLPVFRVVCVDDLVLSDQFHASSGGFYPRAQKHVLAGPVQDCDHAVGSDIDGWLGGAQQLAEFEGRPGTVAGCVGDPQKQEFGLSAHEINQAQLALEVRPIRKLLNGATKIQAGDDADQYIEGWTHRL